MTEADCDILTTVRAQFRGALPDRVGVAVSGGGDSVALLHVLQRLMQDSDSRLFAATVDHGLRPESVQEARQVADLCERLGVEHSILRWRGWEQQGNLQDQARRARYQLLTDWAKSQNIPLLALGHTADDQAETLLMRMARASGVTGLSAMPVKRTVAGVSLFRPMLEISRDMLRAYLRHHDLTWIDDPSNEDERFERVRIRKAMEVLRPVGLTPLALSQVASNLGKAREALDWYTFLAARDLADVVAGAVVLDNRQFRALPLEISRRLLVRAMTWVSDADYPPRRTGVSDALNAIRTGQSLTLHGCRVIVRRDKCWICREFQAVRDHETSVAETWDGRWVLHGGDAKAVTVRALGEAGLKQCKSWRDEGLPREILVVTPALWKGDDLLAAPLAGAANGWEAHLAAGHEEFFASILSH
ncbi:MAG: tRNA lysidine(34) synthetase TilS [Rhodobacteraceae bacterium]|nr:tRNA lysidine(34) synthetase TilS [Paracoccaceae bacterium]